MKLDETFSHKMKDSGYVVFDFVEIGKKSKAPVISSSAKESTKTGGKALKKEPGKKRNSSKNTQTSRTKKNNENAVLFKNKKNLSKKKNPKPKETSQKSNRSKSQNERGVVNLRKNKEKTDANQSIAKKSFDTFLDKSIANQNYDNLGMMAEEVGSTLTSTQIDLVRQTIKKCWHFPAGLKNAEDLVVDIELELDPNGNVQKANILDSRRLASDSNFKIAAENAVRAVLDQDCNPLPLPREKYNEWKNLTLSFNPAEMFK
jgi:hypothetical protein